MNPASSVATTFVFFGMLLIWPDQDHPWSFVSVKRQTGFSCSISISCPHLHEHAATSSRLIRWDKCGLMFCVSPVASVRYVKKVAGLWARIYIYVVIFWRENSWLRDASCFFLPKSLETFQTCMQWFAQTAWLGISGSSHVLVGSQQATLFKNVGEHYMWNVPCRVSKFVNWFLLWSPSSLARSSRMFDTKFNWRHPGSPEVWSPIRKKNVFSMLLYVYRYIYWLVTCSGSWLLSFNQHLPHCLQLTYQQFWKSMLSSMVRGMIH